MFLIIVVSSRHFFFSLPSTSGFSVRLPTRQSMSYPGHKNGPSAGDRSRIISNVVVFKSLSHTDTFGIHIPWGVSSYVYLRIASNQPVTKSFDGGGGHPCLIHPVPFPALFGNTICFAFDKLTSLSHVILVTLAVQLSCLSLH